LILYVLLHRKGSTDWAGNKISENYNNLAKHHIFPRDLLIEEGYDDVSINHLGNITFVNSEINLEVQNEKPEEYLKDYSKILKYHFIPLDENLWKVENYEEFIKNRMNLVSEEFIKEFDIKKMKKST
ncbi:MAG: hypothetical protein N3D09_04025, partial [Archaeoglobaceae archaeon]|nr:hypothetical protein [Archaeoglobaceae archaeon]